MASNFRSFQHLLILALILQHFNTQFSSANRPLSDEKKKPTLMKPSKMPIPSHSNPNSPIPPTAPFLKVSPSMTANSPMLPPLQTTVPAPSFEEPDVPDVIMVHPILPGLPILPPLPQLPPLPNLPLIPSIPSIIPSFPLGPGSSDASALVHSVSEDNGKATP